MSIELVANSTTPGVVVPLGTLTTSMTSGVGTVPASAAAPAALQASSGQFRVVIDNEIILIAASGSGAAPWTATTRGAEGSTAAAHLSGASIFHYLTAGALDARYAQLVEPMNTVGTSSTTQTIPEPTTAGGKTFSQITLTANCTITLPTPVAGKSCTVVTAQDGTGGRSITWATPSGAIKWPGGASPTYTTTASAIDATTFVCSDGTNWLGMPAGYAFA